ncbi:hypothetical protein A2W24_04735 [Microgenomates group bacterium RBG_16_45_19]|nr:MAG: hypothetical protein A2W24_04735 [Microgenomates group bacterium RBG_16_45_19]
MIPASALIQFLFSPVIILPGVGPQSAAKLKNLEITTVFDLLHYYPFRHDDLSHLTQVVSLREGDQATVCGSCDQLLLLRTKTGRTLQKCRFSDVTGSLSVTWFNQPFLITQLRRQPQICLSGTVTRYHGQLNLVSPEYEFTRHPRIHTGRLVPIYHETKAFSSKWLRSRLAALLDRLPPLPDWLPPDILTPQSLIAYDQALRAIHFPDNQDQFIAASRRLKFDELLAFQLLAQKRRRTWLSKHLSYRFKPFPQKTKALIRQLPFTLSLSQQSALQAILTDLSQATAMNRLLQGEVGSGKTVVAAIAMYLTHLNGLASVLMAPTDILARQHYATIKQLLTPLSLKPSLQTQALTLSHPQSHFIIGTHALLFRPLPPNLGLVVIDEQHRFGVHQRTALLKQPTLPNVLSLTATPIPRTLALTIYAELAISYLKPLPHQQTPVKTWLVPEAKRPAAYTWIKQQIDRHQDQVFFVCPLIADSPQPQLDQVKAAETTFDQLRRTVFKDYRVGLLHSRLKAPAKAAVLTAFRHHQLDLLVSTPVIEVGIDIPNATIMVIEAAERFGLAQLHQLRGRVGRGTKPGYCLLFTTTAKANQRLTYLTTVADGNRLATLDLKLRGQGDLYGTRQSGHIAFRLASFQDLELIQAAHQAAVAAPDQLLSHPYLTTHFHSQLEKLNGAI